MSAIIQFQDEPKATLKDGVWYCDNADLREILMLRMEMLDSGYRPNSEADMAREVAEQVGAHLISYDHAESTAPADAQF